MFILIAEAKEMLNPVQSFVFAEHVHKVMFVFMYLFESFHWIVGFESKRNLLWVVVIFILRGQTEIFVEKCWMLERIVVGVGLTVLSKKIAFALVEVRILIFHACIGCVLIKEY
jgi:hypothetical protein